ncbi:MAG: hypothetical protein FWG89_06455 [Treponema sp.]|nr:hypothetical protein [Treponema sp.]
MKKTYFIAFFSLCALVPFSCSNGISLPTDGDGKALLTLHVNGSASRALTGDLAVAGTDFYEVSFISQSNTIIRTSWGFAGTGRILLNPGNYKAMLFAGRNMDKTLLGAGKVTDIAGTGSFGSVNPAEFSIHITAATNSLTFTVYPLLNNITAGTDSTFTIEPPGLILDDYKDNFGNNIPVFQITANGPSTAKWRFGIGDWDLAGSNIVSDFAGYIVTANTPRFPRIVEEPPAGPPKLDWAFTTALNGGDSIPDNGIFAFTLTPKPFLDGETRISLEIPVVAFSSRDNPVIWNIRGGLNNNQPDAGKIPSNDTRGMIGGTVVLNIVP